MKQTMTVAKQVLMKNLKSWGYYLMVFGPLIFMVIVGLIVYFVSRDAEVESSGAEIAVVSQSQEVNQFYTVLDDPAQEVRYTDEYHNIEEATEAISNEEVNGILEIQLEDSTVDATLYHEGELIQYQPAIDQVLSQLQMISRSSALDISQEDLASLSEPVVADWQSLDVLDESLTADDEMGTDFAALGIAYAINIGLFIFIMFYSGIIAQEIATEKGSRVMEVILSSITASQHFFGKLIGILGMIVIHVAIYVVGGFLAWEFVIKEEWKEMLNEIVNFDEILGEMLLVAVVLSILAFIMYSVISAFLGSLASKTEDANKVMTPLVFTALIGFYIGLFSMNGMTDNLLVRITSFVPLWTPLVMPFRMAANTVSTMEVWLAIIGTALFTVLITWLALVFYRSNVLVYSSEGMINLIKRSWKINKGNRQAKQS